LLKSQKFKVQRKRSFTAHELGVPCINEIHGEKEEGRKEG